FSFCCVVSEPLLVVSMAHVVGFHARAMCWAKTNGILAIAADAALRALLLLPVNREIEGSVSLNQSPPCLMPVASTLSRLVPSRWAAVFGGRSSHRLPG